MMISNSESDCDVKTNINKIKEEQRMFREHLKAQEKVNKSVQTMLKMILAKIYQPASSARPTFGN